MQTGTTDFESSKENIKISKYLDETEYMECMKKARVIITHAGVGTIIQGLKLNKKMIVAPRLKQYKEHVKDHQIQIVDTFEKEGYILALRDFNKLQELLNKDFEPKKFISNNEKFNELLEKEIG